MIRNVLPVTTLHTTPPKSSSAADTTAEINQLDFGLFTRLTLMAVRLAVGLLWVQNVNWKHPPLFGRPNNADLYEYTRDAVTHPVLPPFAWAVKTVVLPNFTIFGYLTLILEFGLAVFLLAGLLTRLAGTIALLQTFAITFSALFAPGEWQWSYYLMIAIHLVLITTAAGRTGGLDGLLRPRWARSDSTISRLLLRLS